ncbi:MAG: ATP synthase F0 subunit B [Clostridiales bacterium]|nr:ATP synthase F0 subunit B [Clostridiales bacterium]
MDINPIDIIIHIINIVVLFVLLRLLVYKPVSKFIKERADSVNSHLENAAQKEAEASKLLEQYNAQIMSAENDAKSKVLEITTNANREADEIIGSANNMALEIIEKANQKAQAEYDSKMNDLSDDIADVAVNMAKQILQREVTVEDNQKIIDDFFNSRKN